MDDQSQQPQNKEEATLTIKKSTIWKLSTGILGVLLIISMFTGGFGIGDGVTGQAVRDTGGSPTPTNTGGDGVGGRITVDADDDPFLGDEDAPVTIIEFSDFECPFCGRFYTQTEGQIIDEYVDTGKVKFVYRDFPLTSIHPNAQISAEASECADDQGKFWEYHDLLFEKQQEWVRVGESQLKQYAEDLGLDTSKFNDCLDSGKHTNEVNQDSRDAVNAGGRGTPYFVIVNEDGNTIPLSGAQPYSSFQAAIESALA